jgi:hypothetical protein
MVPARWFDVGGCCVRARDCLCTTKNGRADECEVSPKLAEQRHVTYLTQGFNQLGG